jgi:hypothetical protein
MQAKAFLLDKPMVMTLFLTHCNSVICAILYPKRSLTWREYVHDLNPTLESVFNQVVSLIPQRIPDRFLQKESHFSRDRKLPFAQLVSFLLSASASDKNNGLNIKIGEFAKQARRSGLLPDADAYSAGALSKARAKVPWQAFESIFRDAVDMAAVLWDAQQWHCWHNMPVYAIDGSKYTLPASDELRQEFDPTSGFDTPGKGHYPQCLVSTAYDVFRRYPVACCAAPYATSEREEARGLLPLIPGGGVILFDRGYPSYDFLLTLLADYIGYFVLRCPAESTFPAVVKFVRSNKRQDFIRIKPTITYLQGCTPEERQQAKTIILRAIRLESPDGTVSVLLTNMIERVDFPLQDIIDLYFQRYRIEEYYRDEKITIEIEKFHSRSPNGIRQELFAAAIMSLIGRLLINLTGTTAQEGRIAPQFKNAVIAVSRDAFLLTPESPEKALLIFKELLDQIARVKYYRPASRRVGQPRVCKKPPNKWCDNRAKALSKAAANA